MKFQHIIPVIFFAAVSCGEAADTQPSSENSQAATNDTIRLTSAQLQNARIVIGQAERKSVSEEIQVTGHINIAPQNMVSVSFPLGGYLKENKMLPGTRVRKGDVLAVIEHNDLIQLQENYLIARIELKTLSENLERQRQLNRSKISSDKVLQEAEEKYQTQKIKLKSLEEKLKLIGIFPGDLNEGNISRAVALRAPISGYVSKVNFNSGKYLQPNDEIFEIINPEGLYANLVAFEKDLHKIKAGNEVIVRSDHSDKAYKAQVKMLTPGISEDRTATVICNLQNPSGEIFPGMFVTATIYSRPREVLVIAEEALIRKGDENFLLEAITDSVFVPVPVIPGFKSRNLISIIPQNDHELEGKRFIVKNPFRVMGMLNKEEE